MNKHGYKKTGAYGKAEAAVRSAAAQYGMFTFPGGRGVLVGFSGGADSTVLLHIMADMGAAEGFSVAAAHINHNLRGEESDRDERFCRGVCGEAGIPLYVLSADVTGRAERDKTGIEEAARAVRYEFFVQLLSDHPELSLIATAHNATDNAETVIQHLARGSGSRGLCGIPPVRGNIIRPLIRVSKADIEAAAREMGFSFVFDSTNASVDYTRNYIRHEILPRMAHISAGFTDAVSRASASLTEDCEYLDGEALRVLGEAETENGVYSRDALKTMPEPIFARAVCIAYSRTGADGSPERIHINKLRTLLSSDSTAGSMAFPGHISAVFDRHTLSFSEKLPEKEQSGYSQELLPGENILPRGRMYVYDSSSGIKNINIYKLSIHTDISSAKIKGKLIVRCRRNGDSYRCGGMTRSLRRVFCDRKLTAAQKDSIPVVCDGDGILWVPGLPPRDGTRPCSGEEIITLCYEDGIKTNNDTGDCDGKIS